MTHMSQNEYNKIACYEVQLVLTAVGELSE